MYLCLQAENYMKRILIIIALIVIGCTCWHFAHTVTRYDLPEGELKWTDKRPETAKMCLPAAFTDEKGRILGAYRINGKNYDANKTMKLKVSLKGNMFYISKNWMADNGFQQLTLVYNSKPMKFHDTRKAVRRALCKDRNGAFILQSNYPMTMSDFASECSKCSTNAAYLDMGEFGYGYIKNRFFTLPLYVWGYFSRDKQTNWIYIE
jgi:hypothetical protein